MVTLCEQLLTKDSWELVFKSLGDLIPRGAGGITLRCVLSVSWSLPTPARAGLTPGQLAS